jgi:hypothetical protein
MTAYRDDLEAALAHADASERELDKARAELAADHERIAELEQQLADAKRKLGEAERAAPKPKPKQKPAPAKPSGAKPSSRWIFVAGCVVAGLVLIGGVVAIVTGQGSRRGRGSYPVVDIVADERAARDVVKETMPDAELYELRADYVDPNGRSDLGRYAGGRVYLEYRSPSAAATTPPPPSGPIGAPQSDPNPPVCTMTVRFDGSPRSISQTTGRGTSCGSSLPTPMRCTVVDVWKEALRRGAPDNAIASIRLRTRTRSKRTRSTWSFTIPGKERDVFSLELFDDECPWGARSP